MEKIVYKEIGYPLIDLPTLLDFTPAPKQSKVIAKVFRYKGKNYISLKDPVKINEVFKAGNLGFHYKVTGGVNFRINGLPSYPIKRTDGNSIVQLDIDSIPVGSYVKIFGRKSFQEHIDQTLKAINSHELPNQ